LGMTAAAPVKGTWLGGLNIRTLAGDFWLTHKPSVTGARNYSMQKVAIQCIGRGSCPPSGDYDQAGLTGTVVL
jgi:hypothetical protein